MLVGHHSLNPPRQVLYSDKPSSIGIGIFGISNQSNQNSNKMHDAYNSARQPPPRAAATVKRQQAVLWTLGTICILVFLRMVLARTGHAQVKPTSNLDLRTQLTAAQTPYLVPNFKEPRNKPSDYYVPQSSSPSIVIVTDVDQEVHPQGHLEKVLENRKTYAARHGYGVYSQFVSDYRYRYQGAVEYKNWAKLGLLRSAMLSFPHAQYFFFLSSNAVIKDMNTQVEHFLNAERLDKMMLREQPILKSSNIIKTISHVRGTHAEIIMVQDEVGMSTDSFIMKRGMQSASLLDFWSEGALSTYTRFEASRNDADALNHLLQWHHSFLRRLAVIPTRYLGSLTSSTDAKLQYAPGDFVAVLPCTRSNPRDCEKLFQEYVQ